MSYDAIIIGSGFGGSVAASLLSGKKKNVLILERGTWWVTPEKLGQPPTTTKDPIPIWAKKQNPEQPVQYWPRPDHKDGLLDLFACIRHAGNPNGLYQYSFFPQAHVLTANGVGGGSLIYSNVTIRPPDEALAILKQQSGMDLTDQDFQNAYAWMANFRGKLHQIVTKIPLPGKNLAQLSAADSYLYLDRSRKLKEALQKIESQFPKLGIQAAEWGPLDLSVIDYEDDPQSDAAKAHTFCERQGRCMLGCLPAARHTLNKSLYNKLLTDPASGVALQPLAKVLWLERKNGQYIIHYLDQRIDAEQTVSAPMVFLCAGTLGSTEILLRSRDKGALPLTDSVGKNFSTNGDFGGFAVDTDSAVYSTRGPINTAHVSITMKNGQRITIEDCAIPAMFAAIARTALDVGNNLAQREAFKVKMMFSWLAKSLPDLRDFLPHLRDPHDPTDSRTEAEMVANIFFFNVMGQDDASGRFSIRQDDLHLDWDRPIASHPVFSTIEGLLTHFSTAMGGRYVPLPTWKGIANKKLIITHPLGGCPIGRDNSRGAVNAFGQVFDGTQKASANVLPGLYVVDGSTIPGPLAANPTLTIAAQAYKAVSQALR